MIYLQNGAVYYILTISCEDVVFIIPSLKTRILKEFLSLITGTLLESDKVKIQSHIH